MIVALLSQLNMASQQHVEFTELMGKFLPDCAGIYHIQTGGIFCFLLYLSGLAGSIFSGWNHDVSISVLFCGNVIHISVPFPAIRE